MSTEYENKEVEDECFARCNTIEEFRQYCEDGYWGDEHGFYQDTGIHFEDIEGKWFQVVHSRVYLED